MTNCIKYIYIQIQNNLKLDCSNLLVLNMYLIVIALKNKRTYIYDLTGLGQILHNLPI